MNNNYSVSRADTRAKYEGLRALWCRTFGDPPEYVDSFYSAFGDDNISGYVVTNGDGLVCSSLTCCMCGRYADGRPVYMSYAICTAPEHRGLGLAGGLTAYVRDIAEEKGGVSILSPAEESLIGFYENLGYSSCFVAEEGVARSGESCISVSAEEISAERYNSLRERFLAGRMHITAGREMLGLMESELSSGNAGGAELNSSLCSRPSGFLLINNGDAVCALYAGDNDAGQEEKGDTRIHLAELIVDPHLSELSSEIDEEIASSIADLCGAEGVYYRKPALPGRGTCQSMISGKWEPDASDLPPYWGFPVD